MCDDSGGGCLGAAQDHAEAGRRGYEAADPMIGMGGDGHTFRGATLPFGYVAIDEEGAAALKALEYAFDEGTITRMVDNMGEKAVAYPYSQAGQRWRTQARLAEIMCTHYAPRPDGLSGNDDLGQMSASHLFTAMGFYPVAPGSNEYIIWRPFVPEITLNLPNGQRFHIIADGLDAAHGYVGGAMLNGKPLDRAFLRHEEIMAGGELKFCMQATPDKDWGGECILIR